MLEEDFVWVKPCNMPVQQLLAWAVHLYARQERRKNGEDIEVLAFYAIDKRRRQLTSSGADEGSGTSRPTTKGGKRATKASDGSNARPGIRADLSGDETVGQSPTLEKNIVFEAGSPGAAGMYWKDRVIFLKSLCQSKEYQKLLGWLNEHQVSREMEATGRASLITFLHRHAHLFPRPMGGSLGLHGHGGRIPVVGFRLRCTKMNLGSNRSLIMSYCGKRV